MQCKNLEPCTDSFTRKQQKIICQKTGKSYRINHVLDLVHMDVFSMGKKSLGGA